MRALLQRVTRASVEVEGETAGQIGAGWLVLLGVGWNFALVGATTMVTETHRPEERNKVQAFNDFCIFGTMAVGSFVSGGMLAHFGWFLVNVVMFPVVVLTGPPIDSRASLFSIVTFWVVRTTPAESMESEPSPRFRRTEVTPVVGTVTAPVPLPEDPETDEASMVSAESVMTKLGPEVVTETLLLIPALAA